MIKIKKYINKVLFVLGFSVCALLCAALMSLAPKFIVTDEDDGSLSIVIKKDKND